MYNEDITFFDTIRVWVYDGIFILNSIRVYTHARASIPGKNRPSIKNGIEPNNNLGIQRFYLLDIPTKYQYLTGVAILLCMGKFFDTITDVHY